MSHEIEVKFRIVSFSAVRRAMRREGAVHVFTLVQTDTYFDTPGKMLLGRDCGLRIRQTRCLRPGAERPDTRPILTVKGPARGGKSAKIRREVQVHMDDVEAVEEILRAAGLAPTFTVRKKRSTYRLGTCLVELDELPEIGRFVEVESRTKTQLDRTCLRLGLTGERITDHYIALLEKGGRTS